ncbi:7tm 6 domain containing protein [Asbolus verrucosus]|uniref:Odorant receptor n=1 Tax=Asbolus verrucosus TaxID=1661398 RepID=A0A482WC97_ASBVE|nr:7tm 6 domain containing protein [Asbolus verrucosus]
MVMRALRLYSGDGHTNLHKIQGYIMYVVCIILVPALIITNLILQQHLDIWQINNNVIYAAETISWITKLLPFLRNGDQIKMCIHYFEDSLFTAFKEDEQKRIIQECTRICKRNSFAFLVGCMIAFGCFVTAPLFWKDYRFPFDLWLPFNATARPEIYFSVYVFLIIKIFYVTLSGASIDPLIAGLAYHATAQLRILKYNLKHISRNVDDGIWTKNNSAAVNEKIKKCEIRYNQIKECVDHHNAILTFAKIYEECFSLSVFSQFAGSAVAICFSCLQLSMNNSLINGIYAASWYDYDMKSKKALITLMERSKTPMIITAGKILPLTLETFTMMLKRTYSLIAVLKNYQ